MSESFSNTQSSPVATRRISGVISTSPAKIDKIPRGSVIKIYPTSAGAATVYSTSTPQKISTDDDTNAAIIASTAASWDVWGAGDVTVKTVQQANVPLETVALVVTSGTWVMEVTI